MAKPRSASQSTKKPGRVPPITADRLLRGWPGPAGTRIRLAAPGDAAEVRDLLAFAELSFDQELEETIEAGTVVTTILTGLRAGMSQMLRPLAEAAAAGRPQDAMIGLATVLVAESPSGQLHGALQAVPPGNVLSEGAAAGVPLPLALVASTKVAKIRGLAVAPTARGLGIGDVLLRRAVRLYHQLDWLLLYGQFPAGSGLDSYYGRRGFTVLPPGTGINLAPLNLPVDIHHEPGEQLFVRWRSTAVR
jgi:GNAT superfamily N-acetyltransferase